MSAKPTGENALGEDIESLLSLSLRAQGWEDQGEWERGGEGACRGALFLGPAILGDKLPQMGSPPRAKSSAASDPPEAESLSCKTCVNEVSKFKVSHGRHSVAKRTPLS